MLMRGLWAVAVAFVVGVGSMAGQAPQPFTGIAHVAVRVKDLDVAEDFYKKLGFVQAFALSRDGKVYEAFVKINDRQVLELYPVATSPGEIGFWHICFDVPDAQALHDDYASRGLMPGKAGVGSTKNLLFSMKGPEGVNMEFLQYLPDGMHMKDAGQHLDPDRVAQTMTRVSLAVKDKDAARAYYVDKLGFKPSSKEAMVLTIPGDSGQQVEIVGDELGKRAEATLTTKDMKKAAARLKVQGVEAKKDHGALVVTDPDGNLWRIEGESPTHAR
jgi:catechol 2,3-dioxygenase-like lactoylglutathione lyase family enzyme